MDRLRSNRPTQPLSRWCIRTAMLLFGYDGCPLNVAVHHDNFQTMYFCLSLVHGEYSIHSIHIAWEAFIVSKLTCDDILWWWLHVDDDVIRRWYLRHRIGNLAWIYTAELFTWIYIMNRNVLSECIDKITCNGLLGWHSSCCLNLEWKCMFLCICRHICNSVLWYILIAETRLDSARVHVYVLTYVSTGLFFPGESLMSQRGEHFNYALFNPTCDSY